MSHLSQKDRILLKLIAINEKKSIQRIFTK